VLQVIDVQIMRGLTDEAHVGIYRANYRLGIAMMVFVSMFEYAWRPFFLQYGSKPDAKQVFARVLTYFTVAAAALFLLVSFFVEPLAHFQILGRTVIDSRYWSGLTIVPIVLAAYIFNGWYTNFIAGVYLEKRMKQLPWITGVAAASNIVGNFILIPMYGITGAAWATFISYALMAGLLYSSTRRYFPVKYEWGRIMLIAGATLVVFGAESILRSMFTGGVLLSARIGLLVVFVVSFFAMPFFSTDERTFVKGLLSRFSPGGRDGK
jgi:O-antigen/teichoic acid export membrane protein